MFLGTFEVGAMGTVSAFGISDDGQTLVFGISDGASGSVYVIDSRQDPRLIASMHHPSAIQFLRNSANALIADDIDNSIYAFFGAQIYPIAGPADGIATPVGIAISNDNQKVFVGNAGTGSVTTIGLNGTGTQSAPCNCTLAELQPTSVDSVFELTGFSGGSISLFDGNSATPRMILVPVGAQF
jgi:DNA-binding beta-propeller fold protein YncE